MSSAPSLLSGEIVTAICERFVISREAYYVYLRRYRAGGIDGLEPKARQSIL
ncbi:MAG: helix-turn-helix domain-containing protein [Acidimicrobiales bacterium]|jgi:transposase